MGNFNPDEATIVQKLTCDGQTEIRTTTMNDQSKPIEKAPAKSREEKSGRVVVWVFVVAVIIGIPMIYQLAKYVLANTMM